MNARYTMASSSHSNVISTQNNEVTFLFCLDMHFSINFPCLGEARASTINSDLTNFAGVQRLHENIK